jgi:hypothetical protein
LTLLQALYFLRTELEGSQLILAIPVKERNGIGGYVCLSLGRAVDAKLLGENNGILRCALWLGNRVQLV